MNVFNRALATLFALILMVGGLGAFFLAVGAPNELNAFVQGWALYVSDQVAFVDRLALGVGSAITTVVGLLIFLLELPRRSRTTVRLKKVDGGEGVLSVGAIAQRVQHDVELLEGVRRAKPLLHSRGKKVDVRIDVTTDPYVEAAAKTAEVCQAIRDNVEGQMGVLVRRINVRISHEPIKDSAPRQQTSDAPTAGPR